MKIIYEKPLWAFEFWSGARNKRELLTPDQMDAVEEILEDIYPEGIDAGELNDLFWFDFDTVCEWLGIENPERE